MTRRRGSILRSLLLPAIVCTLSIFDASGAGAQVRRGRAEEVALRWAPISIGVRFGYDQVANAELLGAQLHIPLTRNGVVELATFADVLYPRGTREHQYSAEVLWIPGGARQGGPYVGGGIGWRDTVFGSTILDPQTTTYFGYSVVLGVRSFVGPLEMEIAIRWIYLNDTSYRPNSVGLGINLPLWRVRPARS